MKLLNLLIPKGNTQRIIEAESWTVGWSIRLNGYDNYNTQFKVFIDEGEAKEFMKQLKNAAKFTGAYVRVQIEKN